MISGFIYSYTTGEHGVSQVPGKVCPSGSLQSQTDWHHNKQYQIIVGQQGQKRCKEACCFCKEGRWYHLVSFYAFVSLFFFFPKGLQWVPVVEIKIKSWLNFRKRSHVCPSGSFENHLSFLSRYKAARQFHLFASRWQQHSKDLCLEVTWLRPVLNWYNSARPGPDRSGLSFNQDQLGLSCWSYSGFLFGFLSNQGH